MSTYAQKKGFGATLWDYLTTVDHKKIAILYLIAGGLFFVIGGIEAMIIRIQLADPDNDFVSAGLYNEIINDARNNDDILRGHASDICIYECSCTITNRCA